MKERKNMMRGLLMAVALLFVIDLFGYTPLLSSDYNDVRKLGYTLGLTNDPDGNLITCNAINRIIISTMGEEGYEACMRKIVCDSIVSSPHIMEWYISYGKYGFSNFKFTHERIIALTLRDPYFKQKKMNNIYSQIDTVYGFIEPEYFFFDDSENKSVKEHQINGFMNKEFHLRACPPFPQLENDTTGKYHIDFKRVWQIIDRISKIKVKYFK